MSNSVEWLSREFGFPWLPITPFLALDRLRKCLPARSHSFLVPRVDRGCRSCVLAQLRNCRGQGRLLPAGIYCHRNRSGVRYSLVNPVRGSRRALTGAPYAVGAIAIVLTLTVAFAANWPFNNRRHYFIAHDYVENLFSTIAPDGLLLTQDWQVVSPMFYAQEIEQRRRDVKVIDINLLRRSWYFDYLKQAHPGLIDRSREKIDPYVELLKQWERDPAAFARNQDLTQRISMAFLEMIQSMVRNEIKVAPVYITNDLLSADKTNGYLTQWIPQTYQLVPQGLVFNLATDQGFHDPPDLHLRTRGLADGTLRFSDDDVVKLKVLPVYTRMLTNRGRYLAAFNQHERAIVAFKEALALDPNLAAAQQGLAESTAKLRNP